MAKEPAEKEKKKTKERRPQALKRDIQSKKNRLRNREEKAEVRTAIRLLENVVPKGDKTEIQKHLNEIYSLMDKGVKKGVFKQNKANRTKARLAALVHSKPAVA